MRVVLGGPTSAREVLPSRRQHPKRLARLQTDLSKFVWSALVDAHCGEATLLDLVAEGFARRGVSGLPRCRVRPLRPLRPSS